jgi:hypothetical protein
MMHIMSFGQNTIRTNAGLTLNFMPFGQNTIRTNASAPLRRFSTLSSFLDQSQKKNFNPKHFIFSKNTNGDDDDRRDAVDVVRRRGANVDRRRELSFLPTTVQRRLRPLQRVVLLAGSPSIAPRR